MIEIIRTNELARWVISLLLFSLVVTILRRGYAADGAVRVSSLAGFTVLTFLCVCGLSLLAGIALSTFQYDSRIFSIALQLPYAVLFLASVASSLIYLLLEFRTPFGSRTVAATAHLTFIRWRNLIHLVLSLGLIAAAFVK